MANPSTITSPSGIPSTPNELVDMVCAALNIVKNSGQKIQLRLSASLAGSGMQPRVLVLPRASYLPNKNSPASCPPQLWKAYSTFLNKIV